MVYFLEFLLSNMETFEIRAGPTDLPKTNGRATNKTQHNTTKHTNKKHNKHNHHGPPARCPPVASILKVSKIVVHSAIDNDLRRTAM